MKTFRQYFYEVQWQKPQLKWEQEELERVAKNIGIAVSEVIQAFNQGKATSLDSQMWNDLQNATSAEPINDLAAAQSLSHPDRRFDLIKQGFEQDGPLEMPVVAKLPNGSYTLVAGNTRLNFSKAYKQTPQVWLIDVSHAMP